MDNVSKRPWEILDNHVYDKIDEFVGTLEMFNGEDSQYIIKAVNEHDALVAEVGRLREALKKCSPTFRERYNDSSCKFCGEFEPHKENCEYLKLINKKD